MQNLRAVVMEAELLLQALGYQRLESESGRMVSRFYLEDLFLSRKLLCAAAAGIGGLPIHSDCVLHIRKLGGRNLDALPHRRDIKVHRYGFL